jgi:hypothetical protein
MMVAASTGGLFPHAGKERGGAAGAVIDQNGFPAGHESRQRRLRMQDYTNREKARITAGAITAIVIVGLMAVIALAFLWMPPP